MSLPPSRLSTLPSHSNTNPHIRHSSLANSNPNNSSTSSTGLGGAGSSPALIARINEKKAELENLTQLRDLSAQLAGQMEGLKERIETLGKGTEAVAAVLANWHNVLRAISMASAKLPQASPSTTADGAQSEDAATVKKVEGKMQLPATLVRIPVEEEGVGV